MMAPPIVAVAITARTAEAAALATTRSYQTFIRSGQADLWAACLGDILPMLAYGSQAQSVKRGARQIMSVYDEGRALDGLQSLDSQAVGAVYDQYFSEVYRYVRYRINDDAAAEDIASDVFMRLLEAVQKR